MASLGTKILTFFSILLFALPMSGQQLLEGDLLFACSDTPNAITAVTSGIDGLPIDHVAIVHYCDNRNDSLFVIEAIDPAVCLTPIDTFLCRNGAVIVGRVNVDFDVDLSVRRCLLMVGRPYDDLYLPGDSALYCSELVQRNYVAPSGELIFGTIPMSFHDQTGRVTDYWQEFYGRRGMAVPESEPGSNPGELSRRPQVTIIGKYPSSL